MKSIFDLAVYRTDIIRTNRIVNIKDNVQYKLRKKKTKPFFKNTRIQPREYNWKITTLCVMDFRIVLTFHCYYLRSTSESRHYNNYRIYTCPSRDGWQEN